jgi:hypothetical protein
VKLDMLSVRFQPGLRSERGHVVHIQCQPGCPLKPHLRQCAVGPGRAEVGDPTAAIESGGLSFVGFTSSCGSGRVLRCASSGFFKLLVCGSTASMSLANCSYPPAISIKMPLS